jgi:hypothetical protein
MTSRFAGRERRISAAVDREYGERTRITPRRQGEFVSDVVDPARAVIDLVGIADFVSKAAFPKDTSRFDGAQPYVAADVTNVSYDAGLFGSPADYPKPGDLIELIDRYPVVKLAISVVEDDRLGRVVCRVLVAS